MPESEKKFVMCQACRGLVEASAKTCPLCGRESVPPRLARTAVEFGGGPFFTKLILTVNVILFALMAVVEIRGGAGMDAFFSSASHQVLADFGSRYPPLIWEGQWWRLITPIFLHLGIAHLLFNSFAFYQIGPQVEEAFGPQKFIFIYLATGIAGNIGSLVFNVYGAGASGSLFGLIGLMAVYGYRMGGSAGQALMRAMLIWAAIAAVFGFVIGADNVNHAGGFISGAGLGFVIGPTAPVTRAEELRWNGVAVAGALLVTASFVMVGVTYGSLQGGGDVIKIDRRTRALGAAMMDSFEVEATGTAEAQQVASELRRTAADLESLSSVDDRSDEIRGRLVLIARRQADLLESEDVGAEKLAESNLAARAEVNGAFNDFRSWLDSILTRYGLEYRQQ